MDDFNFYDEDEDLVFRLNDQDMKAPINTRHFTYEDTPLYFETLAATTNINHSPSRLESMVDTMVKNGFITDIYANQLYSALEDEAQMLALLPSDPAPRRPWWRRLSDRFQAWLDV